MWLWVRFLVQFLHSTLLFVLIFAEIHTDPATVATDAIRDIKDPEHDLTLEELGVVSTSFRPDPRLCQFCSPKGFTVYGT